MGRIIKDPEERRKELIDTAERLFVAEGYDQTAIRDIVREVNVSQGAFYYYFDSKDDILVAVVEKQLAQMENDFHQIADRNDIDEVAKLQFHGKPLFVYFRFWKKDPRLCPSGQKCHAAYEADGN